MLGSEILEIAIGIVFVYLISSLVATSVREAIEGVLKTRAIQLERGIRQLLDDPTGTGFTQKIFDHPLLYGLYAGQYDPARQLTRFVIRMRRGDPTTLPDGTAVGPKRLGFGTNLPSYIPSGSFALALMHTVSGDGPLSIGSFEKGAMLLPDSRLKQAMLVAIGEARGDFDRARKSIEAWYDATMDRVSGWYKRETSWILFGIGLLTALALNVDTFSIARVLSDNNTVRQQLIAHAETVHPTTDPNGSPTGDGLDAEREGLSDLIGWGGATSYQAYLDRRALREPRLKGKTATEREDWKKGRLNARLAVTRVWVTRVIGWLISALAISLGAPFWFDVLNRLMVIRSTVKPFEKSPPEASADRGAAVTSDALAPSRPPGSSAAPSLEPSPATPPTAAATVALRYAFDGADPGSIVVGLMKPVPLDGFAELALPAGTEQTIAATGTSGGQTVSWREVRLAGADDEQKPVAAKLT